MPSFTVLNEYFPASCYADLFRRVRDKVGITTALFGYLEVFHNRQRRHLSLCMMTQVEFELHHGTAAG